MARERLNAIEGIDGRVAVRKDVEQILDADCQEVACGTERRFDVGQPLCAEFLVVRRAQREATELSVLGDVDVETEPFSPPVTIEPETVAWLAALDAPPLDP